MVSVNKKKERGEQDTNKSTLRHIEYLRGVSSPGAMAKRAWAPSDFSG